MNAFTVGYCLGTNFPVDIIVILFYHYTLVNLGEVIGGGGGGGGVDFVLHSRRNIGLPAFTLIIQ